MPSPLFPDFPDEARLWVYVADQPLDADRQAALMQALAPFFGTWTSHGRAVQGAAHILHDRFLLVAATLNGDISGCGIDASVHAIEEAGQQAGVAWLSSLLVFYRDAEGTVQAEPRGAFRKKVRAGEATAETPVFDVSLTTVGDLRQQGLEGPAGSAWHARAFRIPQAA